MGLEEQLREAVRNKDVRVLGNLAKRPENERLDLFRTADENGRTVLFAASRDGDPKVIKALAKHGTSVYHTDNRGQTALFSAALSGNVRAINALCSLDYKNELLHRKDKLGQTALFVASSAGHTAAVTKLVDRGVPVDHLDKKGRTALFQATQSGNVETIEALLHQSANVNHANKLGRTPLFGASWNGKVAVIETLLRFGADVEHADNTGQTALFGASWKGQLEAIETLLRTGRANVNAQDKQGETALFRASSGEHTDAITALENAGAKVNHANHCGQTAYSLHGHGNSEKVGRTLLFHGALTTTMTAIGQTTMEDFLADSSGNLKTTMLQSSISLKAFIVETVDKNAYLELECDPYNISLETFSDDGKMGIVFMYGREYVASIVRGDDETHVSVLKGARAPQCIGEGRVIYTKTDDRGRSQVYENSITNLEGPGRLLCHSLSSTDNEKNWGCFGRTPEGEYFIVYSVIPLRIFKVGRDKKCSELEAVEEGYAKYPGEPVVKKEYPNFKATVKYPDSPAIEKMFVGGTALHTETESIFKGGTRGIEFGQEYLFVGHVALHRSSDDGACFPNWYVDHNATNKSHPDMYFMYFYTIRLSNGMFKISRMSGCFQPPYSPLCFHKVILPCGIAYREKDILVSFGRDDTDCLITSYTESEVNTMLVPVTSWNENNYVFQPNYAASLRRPLNTAVPQTTRSMWRNILPSGRTGLVGTSPDSDGRFNPAITNFGTHGDRFVTAWRKMNGSVENWKGYNQVAIEACSIKIEDTRLVYRKESEIVEFQAGTTTAGGEDPRLITENDCPLVLINDLDKDENRRMYIHNLHTDASAMTIHPFCHNLSDGPYVKEKNWGPFYFNNELHFVYTVNPLVVGKVEAGFKCPSSPDPTNVNCAKISQVETATNLKMIFEANCLGMRGGTPGILFGENEYLFVGHSVQEGRGCFPDFAVQRMVSNSDATPHQKEYSKLYMAFFYTIGKNADGKWNLKGLSCCSHFPGKRENFTKIHFPSGLAKANLGGEFRDAYIVSFGEKDMHGGFCAVNRKFVDCVLRPIDEWNMSNYVVDVNYFQNVANIDPDI